MQYEFKYNEYIQYDWKLMFIGTDEGYVSAVYPDGIDSEFKFQYVYNHTDHLGNIRQNITRENGNLTVLREHNYYPFGLLHKGYNEEKEDLKYDKEQDFIFTVQAQAGRYKYKFQGQERQEDLDLGWDSFKYRNYDYAIGRFFNVDPLAEKFPYNGVYNFSENRVVDASELEGKESMIEIYDADNNKTVLDQSNYSNEDWQNIRQAYFDMTRTRENGGGDWAAYSQRQTPPEMGTLSLYYGDDGLSNVSYQSPGMGERLGHNLEMGAKAFKTFFIQADPLVEGSQASVEFTENMVKGSTLFVSFFVGGEFALAGDLKTAKIIQDVAQGFDLGYTFTQAGAAFSDGNTQQGYSKLLNGVTSFTSGSLLNIGIMNDTDLSPVSRILFRGGLTPVATDYLYGPAAEAVYQMNSNGNSTPNSQDDQNRNANQ